MTGNVKAIFFTFFSLGGHSENSLENFKRNFKIFMKSTKIKILSFLDIKSNFYNDPLGSKLYGVIFFLCVIEREFIYICPLAKITPFE